MREHKSRREGVGAAQVGVRLLPTVTPQSEKNVPFSVQEGDNLGQYSVFLLNSKSLRHSHSNAIHSFSIAV